MVHKLKVAILVQPFRRLAQLALWKEVDRTLVILHLDILVIADDEPGLGQFEYVLIVANWTDYLTGCHIGVLLVCDRCPLNLLDDALLTDAISAEEYTWQVTRNAKVRIRDLKLGVAEHTAPQVALDEVVLQIFE